VKTLCSTCHRGWWHNNEVEAGIWFEKTFPGRWRYIKEKQVEYHNDPGTISMAWYLNRLDELRELVAKMKEEKG
jgi:hypothetical protein